MVDDKKKTEPEIMKFILAAYSYGFLLVLMLIAAAGVWEHQVVGTLFRCTDSLPILDFLPPFVHPGEHTGDAFLVSQAQVYGTWCGYLGAILLLPAVPSALVFALHRKYWRTSEEMPLSWKQ